MAFVGNVIRAHGMENLTMTDRIVVSRGRGRPRKKYLDRVKKFIRGMTTQQILNMMMKAVEVQKR